MVVKMYKFNDIITLSKLEGVKYLLEKELDSLSITEILKMPMFNGSLVIAGSQNLDNKCKNITILETPEGLEWLEGGEFVLSTGYAFKDDEEALKNIVYRAYRRKAAAIAIKEKRYIESIPKEMIIQANKYGIPLIKLPHDLVYTSTITNFYDSLLYKKNRYIYEAKEMHEKLLTIMLENKNVEGTVKALSNLTNFSIIIIDNVFNIIAKNIISGHNDFSRDIKEDNMALSKITNISDISCSVQYNGYIINEYKIIFKSEIIGYMYVISNSDIVGLNLEAVAKVRNILAFKLEEEREEPLNIVNINKIITNIILNSKNLPEEFYLNIKNNYRWNGREKFVGLCMEFKSRNVSSEKRAKLIERVCGLISRIFNEKGFFITEDINKLTLFFSMDEDLSLDNIISKVNAFVNKYDSNIKMAFSISRTYKDIKDIPKMYKECYIASLFNKNEIIYYDTLDSIKILYSLGQSAQTVEYCEKTIGSIENYDNNNKSELMKTLTAFFKYDMSKKLVSQKLHIHPETLRYRLKKIHYLTGYSVNTAEGIFALEMSIKLQKIININSMDMKK